MTIRVFLRFAERKTLPFFIKARERINSLGGFD